MYDETGNYIYMDHTTVQASWEGYDYESGIENFMVGIGTSMSSPDVTGFLSFGSATNGLFENLNLEYFSVTGKYYYLIAKAFNGAGDESKIVSSKRIKLVRGNTPGIVYDGGKLFADKDFQQEYAIFSVSFHGFDSEACKILDYEWAIGSEPGFSDVQMFTRYGVAMINKTHGVGQVQIHLEEMKYFATVRAVMSQNCHERYIVSSSNGITIDHTPPKISLLKIGVHENLTNERRLYQEQDDSLEFHWTLEDNAVEPVFIQIGSIRGQSDHSSFVTTDNMLAPGTVPLHHAQVVNILITAKDSAGNKIRSFSPSLIIDITQPSINDFSCSKHISHQESEITCSWKSITDKESLIKYASIAVGNAENQEKWLPYTILSPNMLAWKQDTRNYWLQHKDSLYVSMKVQNGMTKQVISQAMAIRDDTPPMKGQVYITTAPDGSASDEHVYCQLQQRTVVVKWTGFQDEESGLTR